MIVGDGVGEIGKALAVGGGGSKPGFVELKRNLVVWQGREHVGGLDKLGGHVDAVAAIDDHGVERLQVLQPRHAHDLYGCLSRGREVERRRVVHDADHQRMRTTGCAVV